jgi:serine/threonine protein kinase
VAEKVTRDSQLWSRVDRDSSSGTGVDFAGDQDVTRWSDLPPGSACDLADKKDKCRYVVYILMDYYPAGSLQTFLYGENRRDITPTDIPRRMHLFSQICEGMVHIHSKGVLHRDLKPANIFFQSDNHVRIGDFGLSRLHETHHNPDGAIVNDVLTTSLGTMLYAAPEQSGAVGTYTTKVDVFPLGLILLEMLCNIHTQSEQVHVLSHARKGQFDDVHLVDMDAMPLVRSMLIEDPDDRPAVEKVLRNDWLRAMKNEFLRDD